MDKQASIKLFEEKKVRTAWNEDETGKKVVVR
jgi:hypothetical protein